MTSESSPAVYLHGDDKKSPRHIAIIMDGNGRWAQQRHLPRTAGHRAGLEAVKTVIEACIQRKIEVLTLFAFGKENWRRPAQEVNHLMELFLTVLHSEAKKLHKNNVQLHFIGDMSQLSMKLHASMRQAQLLTAKNSGLKLIIAVDYSGHWDIVEAARKLAYAVQEQKIKPEAITSEVFASFLSMSEVACPDLFIRTSGEQRISNFLLWQLAYTELYFTDILWPDFNHAALDDALAFYAGRQRRFGLTKEQLEH